MKEIDMGLRPITKRWADHQLKKKGEGKTLRGYCSTTCYSTRRHCYSVAVNSSLPSSSFPPCGTIFPPTELNSLAKRRRKREEEKEGRRGPSRRRWWRCSSSFIKGNNDSPIV